NGGTGGTGPTSMQYGATLTAPTVTRTGYTFTGWDPTVPATVGAGDATYTAQWTPEGTYTVTFNANGGTGSMSDQSASAPTALTLNAFTRTGYTFTGWNTEAGGSGTAYADGAEYPFTVSDTLYAQWSVNSYNITFDANGGTGGTGPTSMQYGATLTAPTVTRTGYTFTGWDPTVPATVGVGDATYTAQWSVNSYNITFDANGGDGGTGPTSMQYGATLTAPTVTRVCYTFTGWDPTVPATVGVGDATYIAQWTINTYALTTNTDGTGTGTISTNTSGPYACGTVVQVTANPGACSTFTEWSGDLTGSTNPTTITMDSAKTITATFAIITYALTVNSSGCCDITTDYGTVLANSSQVFNDIPCGTVVNLSCGTGLLCFFSSWTGDVADPASASTTVTVDGNKTVTGTCSAEATYSLTVNSIGCCPIEVTGSVTDTIPAGGTEIYTGLTILDTVTLNATCPDSCCTFSSWTLDGIPGINPLVVTGLTGNAVANATCTIPTYALTTHTDGTGTGTITTNTSGPYACGTVVEVTANPGACSTFTGWAGDLTGSTNPTTITMDAAKDITAT
ncbi:MAG: InlB B-repeat-containing protein, partial [Dehalococcoidia bacterium]